MQNPVNNQKSIRSNKIIQKGDQLQNKYQSESLPQKSTNQKSGRKFIILFTLTTNKYKRVRSEYNK